MTAEHGSTAIIVTAFAGMRTQEETARLRAVGELPRNAAVELARLIGAEIVDNNYMSERAARLSRLVAARVSLPAGQIVEAVLRRGRYNVVLAWADRIGLPLALLNKLTRSRQAVAMISVDLSNRKKAVSLKRFRAFTHLQAIICSSSVQIQLASEELGVPRDKLRFIPPGVDSEFWRSEEYPSNHRFCAVGWEARDYGTFVRAVAGVDAKIEVALGSLVFNESVTTSNGRDRAATSPGETRGFDLEFFEALKGTAGYEQYRQWLQNLGAEKLPDNIEWHQQLKPSQLRALYARSLFVVIPLHETAFDAGYTAILEAMAMGRAVVVSRTRGQIDVVTDGEQGLYVPVGDAEALRRAVVSLLASPDEAERMGRAGRRLVEERYGLDEYVQRVASALHR